MRLRQIAPSEPARVATPQLPLVRQSASWDCGLACVESIVRCGAAAVLVARDRPQCRKRRQAAVTSDAAAAVAVLRAEIRALVGTQRTWTIDLLRLLVDDYAIDATLHTTSTCATPSHVEIPYYSEVLLRDACRINALFKSSSDPARGLRVVEGALASWELARTVHTGTALAIVLLDYHYLNRKETVVAAQPASSFAGHYVVLYGYLPDVDEYVLLDTSLRDAHAGVRGGSFIDGVVGALAHMVGLGGAVLAPPPPPEAAVDRGQNDDGAPVDTAVMRRKLRAAGARLVPRATVDEARGAEGTDDDVILVALR